MTLTNALCHSLTLYWLRVEKLNSYREEAGEGWTKILQIQTNGRLGNAPRHGMKYRAGGSRDGFDLEKGPTKGDSYFSLYASEGVHAAKAPFICLAVAWRFE